MKTINVPVLKSRVGDWVVYWGLMRMEDLAERVKQVDESPYPAWRNNLDKWVMTDPARREPLSPEFPFPQVWEPMRETLIVACLAGESYFSPIEMYESESLDGAINGRLGVLTFTGQEDECLVTYDGQFRLSRIREELAHGVNNQRIGPDLEQVVIFFDGRRWLESPDATS
jgi:hypothetical protein